MNIYLLWHHAFPVPGVSPLSEVVDCGKFNESREDKGIADSDEPVHGCGVGHFGKGVPGADTKCGHGQDGGHSCREMHRQNGCEESDRRPANTIPIHINKIQKRKTDAISPYVLTLYIIYDKYFIFVK